MYGGTSKWLTGKSKDIKQKKVNKLLKGKKIVIMKQKVKIVLKPKNKSGKPERLSKLVIKVKGGRVVVILVFPNGQKKMVSIIKYVIIL